jgi:hypothetical protein
LTEDRKSGVLFSEIISINKRNLIKLAGATFEKIATLRFGAQLKYQNFGAGMSKFTGHRPLTHKLLNIEHENIPSYRSDTS